MIGFDLGRALRRGAHLPFVGIALGLAGGWGGAGLLRRGHVAAAVLFLFASLGVLAASVWMVRWQRRRPS